MAWKYKNLLAKSGPKEFCYLISAIVVTVLLAVSTCWAAFDFTGPATNIGVDWTASRLLYADDSNTISTTDIDDWVNGTANEIVVTAGSGAVWLSLASPVTVGGLIGEGNLLPDADNTRDLGAVGSTDYRWRHLYLSGNLSDETNSLTVANAKTAYDHANGSTGADHTYIDQGVTTASRPTFNGLYLLNDLDITSNPTSTNTVLDLLAVKRHTTGTAAAGMGVSQNFYLEDAGGDSQLIGKFRWEWTDPDLNADFYLSGYSGGTLYDVIKIHQLQFQLRGDGGNFLKIAPTNLGGSDRILQINMDSGNNILTFSAAAEMTVEANSDINQDVTTDAAPTFDTATLTNDSVTIETCQTPPWAGSTGTRGQIAWDPNYLYVCVTTDTWKRAALSDWSPGFLDLMDGGQFMLMSGASDKLELVE